VTPPISSGLLPGTYRVVLLRGGRLVERTVTVQELKRATRIALVSSARGWRPATLLP
jgi:para-aminobenzoate synthetase/4-amino-4-deoxychorismate lyase